MDSSSKEYILLADTIAWPTSHPKYHVCCNLRPSFWGPIDLKYLLNPYQLPLVCCRSIKRRYYQLLVNTSTGPTGNPYSDATPQTWYIYIHIFWSSWHCWLVCGTWLLSQIYMIYTIKRWYTPCRHIWYLSICNPFHKGIHWSRKLWYLSLNSEGS